MKRIWFGAALLAALLVLGFCSSAFMERTHSAQAKDLSRASELALEGNWSGAENFAAAARREWDRKRGLVAGLCDHGPMDQVEGLFSQLEVYASTRDAAAFSSTCVYLVEQLKALGKSHSLNLQNFF